VGSFGSLDHQVMLATLAEKIHDNRFLRLVRNMLTAGYLEDWRFNATLSGAPQGGVVSPILSSIYLHKLDAYVETVLIPQHTQGTSRRANPQYDAIRQALRRARQCGDRVKARELQRRMRSIPSQDPNDPDYRRLRYTRYADDHLLGFIGPKAEAEQIKDQLAAFLRDELKLELNPGKTLVTHARTRAARYLGYEIITQHSDTKITGGRRSINGTIALRVPLDVITAKCAPYQRRGEPEARTAMCNLDDYDIVKTYAAEYRGIVQYYLLATDVWRFTRLRWVTETSMLKTLATKHTSTVSKVAAKHKTVVETPHGKRTCFEASVHRDGKQPLVARFGGIPLVRRKDAVLIDRVPDQPATYPFKELTVRLRQGRCELCQKPGKVQVHQIRKLAQLEPAGADQPMWKTVMARKRRKTLVVCHPCHDTIHDRQPTAIAA
jgi:Type II intron maturase/AI2M/AI1M-like, HNH endonuclease